MTLLYAGAALYATMTAVTAAYVSLRLPLQNRTVGPYNYHRMIQRARRLQREWARPRLL